MTDDSRQKRSDPQRVSLMDRELLEDMITGFGNRIHHDHEGELPSLDVALIDHTQHGAGNVTPMQDLLQDKPPASIDECYGIVMSLSLGQHLLLTQDSGQVVEIQLAWINQSTGKYLFTDELGRKVAERSFRDLATALRKGSLKLSAKPPVLDYPARQLSA